MKRSIRPRAAEPLGRLTVQALAAGVVLATAGGLVTVTAGTAEAAVNCASPVFKRTFYANTNFSGTPRKTDCDSAVDENWGTRAPASGLPADHFGVRWAVTRDFGSGGPFSFAASARDGIRVYVDGVRRIDLWQNVSTTRSKSVNVTIPSGVHTLRVDYVNWTGAANVKFAYQPRTSPGVDTVKPLAPAGASLSYSSYNARFSWARNKEMDLAGYRVYRRLTGTSYGSKPLATTTSTSYTDTSLPRNGAVYYYEVRAVDKRGNESTGTADKGVTTADRTAPAAPRGVDRNWSMEYLDNVDLDWDANTEPDIVGYRVYRSTGRLVAATAANLVSGSAPLTSSWYHGPLPKTGDTYYYVVTAVDKHGNESAPSVVSQGFGTRDETPPNETALNARAVESEAGVTLTWDKSEATTDDFVGYRVYRSLEPRTPGKSMEVERVYEYVQGTSFTDPAPRPGVTYYYWVVAADRAGCLGTPSATMGVRVQGNTTAPPAVTGMTATPKENGVSLDWNAVDDPGLDHYEILRGTLVDGSWTYKPLVDPVTLRAWQITGTHHDDRVPADGEQVRYSVVAVDQYGNALTPDGGATVTDVTEVDLSPDADATPAATGAPLTSLAAQWQGDSSWVSWILSPAADEGGRKATGLNVYRWNPATHVFDKLTATPVERPGGGSGGYADMHLPQGTTSFYRVTVVFDDGTESGASQTAVAAR
ncbi:fibronectin type III domain-containing protein [Streptomyces sp. NPDC004286]|uniref:fibronectin type III domain-containing protein n=1 Tax=Streptomyces sp. NPDC004286 TaxID=3364696 RepID=UPI00369F6B15